jgi:hypothetical protein
VRKRTPRVKTGPSLLERLRSRGRKRGDSAPSPMLSFFKVAVLICVLGAVGVGFVYIEHYVRAANDIASRIGELELIDPPEWMNSELEKKLLDAIRAHGEDLRIDEDAAESVYRNIIELVPWLQDVRIRTTSRAIIVEARWRKPLAQVAIGAKKFYVDKDQMVLDFLPLSDLPVVEIRGIAAGQAPRVGQLWGRDDVQAALDILSRLDIMDNAVTPGKPLLREIAAIDVSNFQGRKNSAKRHIILCAGDNTEIFWGAEFGMSQRSMEVPDEEKIARLYAYYKENGTLLTGVKYINLCDPRQSVPQPTDRYQTPQN